MARKAFVNGFVWVAALTQVQYAVQDIPSSTESPMKYHHERGAPEYPRVVNHSFTYMFVSWSPPNDTADVNNYIINYFKSRNLKRVELHEQKSVPANQTQAYLKGLQPGTRYSFLVVANYSTGHMPPSSTISIQLLGYGEDNLCMCDYAGTLPAELYNCNAQTGQCKCKNNYTKGRTCNECTKSAFWHDRLGCEACPCYPDKTRDGTCYVSDQGVVMCHCLHLHAGRDCHGCHNGYHLVGTECVPCDCSGNQNLTSGRNICDYTTGLCLSCGYNTAGDKCDVCKPGYIGSAVARNCTYDLHVPYGQSAEEVNHNLAIGLTLGIVTILILTTVILAFVKCRKRKKPFNFWTVQLHDDHENVNFSSMMDQDFPYSDTPNGVHSSRGSSQVKANNKKANHDGNVYRSVKT